MEIIWVVLSLIGVLGLFFVLIYALKKLNSGIGFASGSKMRVIDRVTVGREGALLVVSVAGRLMLIGATSGHIEKLGELDMTPEEYAAQSADSSAPTFAEAFSTVLKQKKEKQSEEKGDKNV